MTLVFKFGLYSLLLGAIQVNALDLYDDSGQLFKLNKIPQRVISYTLASDEILLALAKPDQIAALSPLAQNPRYSHISEAAQAYPQIYNIEQIIQLKADLVLLASYNQAEIHHFLKKAQISNFYFSRFNDLDDIKRHIQQLGHLLAREPEAQRLINTFQQDLATAKQQLNCKLPALLSYDQWGYVAGRETIFQSLLDYLEIENLATKIKGYQHLQTEWLYQQKPQIIIMPADPAAFEQARIQLFQHPLLKNSPAVQKKQVLLLDQRYLNSVSQYITKGLEILVSGLKPFCQTNKN